jgi:CBS domain-containing protein
MLSPYLPPPRPHSPGQSLGPRAITPVQALTQFFPQASQNWVASVREGGVSVGERRARDIMHTDLITVRADMPLHEVMQLLSHRRISGAPVVDTEGLPVGVVSLTDVAHYVSQSWIGPPTEENQQRVAETRVIEVMSPFLHFAEEETSLHGLADLMVEHQVHRLLVLREGVVVGLISSLDLIRALAEDH